MKNFTLLLLIACLTAGISARAQTITFHKDNASLKEILKAIKQQTGYGSMYQKSALPKTKRITISATNRPLAQVLDDVFKDQPLTYTLIGKVISIQAKVGDSSEPYTVTGRVMNESGEPVAGATIMIGGSTRVISVNDEGEFLITGISKTAKLVVTSVSHEVFEYKLQGQTSVTVQLIKKVNQLQEVSVVSTGYQNLVKERSTGSFSKVNNEMINRSVTPNILERLDGITPGMILNRNVFANTNQSTRTIRGRSTIFSNAEPLIVVDNFPFPGNINSINPNDIENITVLKDANAAAIWGAFAGNGVIVINTKKGRFNQNSKLTVNNNVTIGEKPDAYYNPGLNSSDYIDIEEEMFSRGYYDDRINNQIPYVLSPVVEILSDERNGVISTNEKNARMAWLRNQDTRREKEKYFYRNSVQQQHAISASGGGTNNHYYLSGGYDRSLDGLVGNKWERFTVNVNNSYLWFKNRLELTTGFAMTETKLTVNNDDQDKVKYPYIEMVNALGVLQTIPLDIRQSYKMSINQPQLLDWNYRPLEEIHVANNTGKIADYRINASLKYKIGKGFTANLIYQYNKGGFNKSLIMSQETYYTRNLINKFAQLRGGDFYWPVPRNGGIADFSDHDYKAHNARVQLNYLHSWKDRREHQHTLSALAGSELRDISALNQIRRVYGYTPMSNGQRVDDSTLLPVFYAPTLVTEKIYNPFFNQKTVDRYISYFFTGTYSFEHRYTISASARKDESNLFGVNTNQKGVPLFSLGAAWGISEEKFYHVYWLTNLRLRVTHGYNGNVNKSVTAFVTALRNENVNVYGSQVNTIINPPNPDLRWEKIQITNFGLDFTIAKDVIAGTIEYYLKRGTDLIGNIVLDPTTGSNRYMGNTARMKGSGIDMSLSFKNIDRTVKWTTTLLFNHSVDRVRNYENAQISISQYYNQTFFNPLEDRPLYSIYSLKWEGLDPETGEPLGSFNGQVSKDYYSIGTSKNIDDLVYSGPANPTFFGSVLNNISYKQLSLSFNIIWKAGHYFRRNSIEYYNLVNGISKGHPDYNLRWQKPGDEKFTNIPSFLYPLNESRDVFFKYSEALVEKGDHIRFQDIQFNYDLTKNQAKKLSMQSVRFYAYVNNVGIIWKATDADIDPDFVQGIPNARSYSVGVKLEF